MTRWWTGPLPRWTWWWITICQVYPYKSKTNEIIFIVWWLIHFWRELNERHLCKNMLTICFRWWQIFYIIYFCRWIICLYMCITKMASSWKTEYKVLFPDWLYLDVENKQKETPWRVQNTKRYSFFYHQITLFHTIYLEQWHVTIEKCKFFDRQLFYWLAAKSKCCNNDQSHFQPLHHHIEPRSICIRGN